MATQTVVSQTDQVPANPIGLGTQVLAFIEALILVVWLGSMIFFSFAVAPTAFAVLPSRHLAGEVVTSSIGKVEVFGLVCGTLLVLLQLIDWSKSRAGAASKSLRLIGVLVMLAAAAGSRFWISPTMRSLRASMGGTIDDVAKTDPLRVQFDNLHQYSVGLMTTAMIAGLVVLFLSVRAWLKR